MTLKDSILPKLLTISPEATALLKGVESLRLKPYDDQTGNDISAWVPGATIGYGHLIKSGEWNGFKGGMTKAQADTLFDTDLAPYQDAVRQAISVKLQQNQYDALVIFCFNIGMTALKTSSVVKLVNDPKAVTGYATLEAAWKAWNTSQGKVMKGLDNRRNCEWKLYDQGVYERW